MAITVNGGAGATSNLTVSADLLSAITDESGTGVVVFNTSPTLVTPTLGTANATAIELGHATDTTLARVSAGIVSIEGVNVVTTSSTATLTNKSLSDSTTSIVDVSDATKVVKFDVGGTTAITGTIATAFTTAKTLSLPDATDTLVGKATTDTLTNKTLTAPSLTGTVTSSGDITISAVGAFGSIIDFQTLNLMGAL